MTPSEPLPKIDISGTLDKVQQNITDPDNFMDYYKTIEKYLEVQMQVR